MCVHLSPFTRIFTVPRALNFGSNSSRVHRHHACLHHARQGDLLRHFAVGAGGINHRKHFISVRHRADGREGHADAGDRPRDNQRFAPGGFHRRHELRVIPGVDLPLACHILCVRRVGVDLRDKRAVRSLWNRRRGDHRDLRQRGDFCQRCCTGAQLRHWHVSYGLEQPALVIDKQHNGIVYVNNGTCTVEVCRGRHNALLITFRFGQSGRS